MAQDDSDDLKKKVDEAWKEEISKEKASPNKTETAAPEASFSLFLSGLMIEALVALGEIEHPVTKQKESNDVHAKFVIDTIAMLKEKTKGNLSKDEESAIDAILYELRLRFVGKLKKG